MSFWGELKRRNVVKVGIAYLVVAWLLAQVVGLVLPTFNAPEWVTQTIIFLLILGLPIVLIVAWAFEITPAGVKLTSSVPRAESITAVTGQRLNYVVTTLLAIAVVFLVIDNYVVDRPRDGAAAASATAPTGQPRGDTAGLRAILADEDVLPNSIAVLPLENLSPNPDDRYYADGLHVEIINQLSKLGNLTVIGRDSVLPFADGATAIEDIAAALRVGSILRGSFQYVNGRIRIVLSLIDPGSGRTLLPLDYQESFADIFSVQSDIAMSVANALRAEFSPEEQQSIEALPTESVEAYDHYLLARSLQGQGLAGDARSRAIAEYEEALRLDPNFKLAMLGLAQAMGSAFLSADSTQRDRAGAAADRAIERARDVPATLGLIAQRQLGALDWAAAERSYREWLEKAPPDDAEASLAYGTFLKNNGRARDALPYLELARRLNPLVALPSIHLTMAYDALGDTDRAIELHGRMENLVGYDFTAAAPQFWRILARDGLETALDVFARANDSTREEVLATLRSLPDDIPNAGRIFRVIGLHLEDRERGLPALREVYDDPTSDNVAAMLNVALLAAYYGDSDLSVAALRRQAGAAGGNVLQFVWTPLLKSVRSHPQFREMIRDLGLPAYWREFGWPEHCAPVGADDFQCS